MRQRDKVTATMENQDKRDKAGMLQQAERMGLEGCSRYRTSVADMAFRPDSRRADRCSDGSSRPSASKAAVCAARASRLVRLPARGASAVAYLHSCACGTLPGRTRSRQECGTMAVFH